MADRYYVQILAHDLTIKPVVLGPYETERTAVRVAGGVDTTLNHEVFYTLITLSQDDPRGT